MVYELPIHLSNLNCCCSDAWQTSPSVPRSVDKAVLGDPRHHGAQFLADLLDLVFGGTAAQRLETGLAGGVFEHPFAGEIAGLDVGQDLFHFGSDVAVDDPGAARVIAV